MLNYLPEQIGIRPTEVLGHVFSQREPIGIPRYIGGCRASKKNYRINKHLLSDWSRVSGRSIDHVLGYDTSASKLSL